MRDMGWGYLFRPNEVASFSVMSEAPAPESNMARALTE